MASLQRSSSILFNRFFKSEKSGGVLLLICTFVSLGITNSVLGAAYLDFWHWHIAGLRIEQWVNDALMTLFFLLIGLELKHELYSGELSSIRKALLPLFAAVGGIVVPALMHFSLNAGGPTQSGMGIPMATDIAFALGILALLGSRVPRSLKVFLTALAIIDDLGAIIVIAVFYTAKLAPVYLLSALGMFASLVMMNFFLRIKALLPYLAGGIVMWYFMLKSGVHPTIAGVLLAFAIPYSSKKQDEASPSRKQEHLLHMPVTFFILPIFALANTSVVIGPDWIQELGSTNSLGIIAGLVIGKPLGITLLVFCVVSLRICQLPLNLNWKHIVGAGALGGIGFTMSIFITNLAFAGEAKVINASKMAILLASMTAGTMGFLWMLRVGRAALTTESHSEDFKSPRT